MTRATTSVFSRQRRSSSLSSAFTLIEMMVVIIIIAVLMAIVIPAVMGAVKKAKVTKTRADMAAIATAMEEYKKDHAGRYPGQLPQTVGLNTGFAMLGRELYGSYGDGITGVVPNTMPDPSDPPTYTAGVPAIAGDCVQTSPTSTFVALVDTSIAPASPSTDWAQFEPRDGYDGPGIRPSGGKKLGPYLQAERFHIQGCGVLDSFTDPSYQHGHPILYFVSRGDRNIHMPVGQGVPSYMAAGVDVAKFDANHNIQFFMRPSDGNVTANAVKRIQATLGDLNFNGYIDGNESTDHNGSYILWSPGPDGRYGPDAIAPTSTDVSKCDDIVFTP